MVDDAERPEGFMALPHATYEASPLDEFRGNPLVEALPPYQLVSEMGVEFGAFPRKPGTDLALSRGQRSLAIGRLRHWLQPLPRHEDVIDLIGNVVRNGYAGRNPLEAEVMRRKVRFYREVSAKDGMLKLGASTSSTAPSMALFGTSGVGKTTVVEFALNQLLPQVLYHPEHKLAQIVWLKLDCPAAGSLKQLLAAMVERMEELVGADHRASTKYETTDPLVLLVARMAIKYNVGIIVVDEIQNLLLGRTNDRDTMLNFLVSMANVARIPIFTMGTPLASDLMRRQLRQSRRTGDMGAIAWDRMPLDKEWTFFLEGMFAYQWVKTPARLTPAIAKRLHDESAGIPAIVVRLFQLVQLQALADETETVTAKAISKVAQERFSLLRPMLDALRAGKDVSQYEDLFAEHLESVDRAVASGSVGRGTPRREATVARDKALAELSILYGTTRATDAIAQVVGEDPNLSAGAIVDRVRVILDDDHAIYDDLPPSLTDLAKPLAGSDADLADAAPVDGRRSGEPDRTPRRGTRR